MTTAWERSWTLDIPARWFRRRRAALEVRSTENGWIILIDGAIRVEKAAS